MTRAEYNANKHAVRALLQNAADPYAFRLVAGVMRDAVMWPASAVRMKELRRQGNDVTFVRGYMLVTTPFLAQIGLDNEIVYSAVPCPVLRVRDADGGKARYETVYDGSVGGAGNAPLLFVPSSRLHPELSDEQLMSGAFQPCHVWSVPPEAVQPMRALRDTHSAYERRRFCFAPEEMDAPRTIVTRSGFFLCEYLSSAASKVARYDHADARLAFGMPYMTLANDTKICAPMDMRADDFKCQDALIDPQPPWKHDRDAWLPSVGALHAAIHDTKGLACREVLERQHHFFQLFVKLEHEYAQRRYTCMSDRAVRGKGVRSRSAGRGGGF